MKERKMATDVRKLLLDEVKLVGIGKCDDGDDNYLVQILSSTA
jgi:hypothetical protein